MSAMQLTKDNFAAEVLAAEQPVLVDFWASWCGPCRMLAPVIDEIAAEKQGTAKVGKVNVDEQPELAAQYNVASIPTLIVFKNGQAAKKLIGVKPKKAIEALLTQ